MILSQYKPLTGKLPPGDEHTRIKPEIQFYKVGVVDKSDKGYGASILIKIDKSSLANKKTL